MYKWIETFEGLYDINEAGQVRRHYKQKTIKIIKHFGKNGVAFVRLHQNGVRYVRSVNQLMIEAFDIHTFEKPKEEPKVIEEVKKIDLEETIKDVVVELPFMDAWMLSKERQYYRENIKNN